MNGGAILAGADIADRHRPFARSAPRGPRVTCVGYPHSRDHRMSPTRRHGLKGQVCADGGCTFPLRRHGYGAAAPFRHAGGMLAWSRRSTVTSLRRAGGEKVALA